jgi:hypothetical protein
MKMILRSKMNYYEQNGRKAAANLQERRQALR